MTSTSRKERAATQCRAVRPRALPGWMTFSSSPRDTLDSVRAGVNLTVIPKRLDLSLGYSFSFGGSNVAGRAGGAASGEPAPRANHGEYPSTS